MAKKEVHTVPNPNGSGWVNEVAGRITSGHRKQSAAIEEGRRQAIQREAEHVIHNRHGQIRDKNSYGNDPYPCFGPTVIRLDFRPAPDPHSTDLYGRSLPPKHTPLRATALYLRYIS